MSDSRMQPLNYHSVNPAVVFQFDAQVLRQTKQQRESESGEIDRWLQSTEDQRSGTDSRQNVQRRPSASSHQQRRQPSKQATQPGLDLERSESQRNGTKLLQRRRLHFDGRYLVCLDGTKYFSEDANQAMATVSLAPNYPAETFYGDDNDPSWTKSPLFATPMSLFQYQTANGTKDERVLRHYYQTPEWIIDFKQLHKTQPLMLITRSMNATDIEIPALTDDEDLDQQRTKSLRYRLRNVLVLQGMDGDYTFLRIHGSRLFQSILFNLSFCLRTNRSIGVPFTSIDTTSKSKVSPTELTPTVSQQWLNAQEMLAQSPVQVPLTSTNNSEENDFLSMLSSVQLNRRSNSSPNISQRSISPSTTSFHTANESDCSPKKNHQRELSLSTSPFPLTDSTSPVGDDPSCTPVISEPLIPHSVSAVRVTQVRRADLQLVRQSSQHGHLITESVDVSPQHGPRIRTPSIHRPDNTYPTPVPRIKKNHANPSLVNSYQHQDQANETTLLDRHNNVPALGVDREDQQPSRRTLPEGRPERYRWSDTSLFKRPLQLSTITPSPSDGSDNSLSHSQDDQMKHSNDMTHQSKATTLNRRKAQYVKSRWSGTIRDPRWRMDLMDRRGDNSAVLDAETAEFYRCLLTAQAQADMKR
jgi:hypothetical protein